MKSVIKIAICFLALTLFCQCTEEYDKINISRQKAKIYNGNHWDICRINDSIIVFVPCGDSDDTLKPITINLKNK